MKKSLITILVILAALSLIVGILYATQTAGQLPHFIPGYIKGSNSKHLKRATAGIVLAVILAIGAWVCSGTAGKTGGDKSKGPDTPDATSAS